MFKKLKDERGITIIHAMVGLLIFMVIGSVIYSSSMSNLKSYQAQKEYQQAYLTVSSAATTFVDSIVDDYITYKAEASRSSSTVSFSKGSPSEWAYVDTGLNNPLVVEGDTSDDFLNQYKLMYNHLENTDYRIEKSYIIKAAQATNSLADVQVDVIFSQYNIYANFYLANASDNNNYYMSVYIPVLKGYDEVYAKKDITNFSNGQEKSYTEEYRIIFDSANVEISKGAYN